MAKNPLKSPENRLTKAFGGGYTISNNTKFKEIIR